MEFDLEKILLALLFSSNEALSVKDVQAVVTRFHQQADELAADADEESAAGETEVQGVMRDLLDQVPSMLTSAQIRDAMERIGCQLDASHSVFRIIEGAQGYRLAVSPDFADWVRLLRNQPRPRKLSPAALETLAIVAYRQPVTRLEIESIRGVSADSAISKLLEKELVAVTGRAELPGRPLQYGTTDAFLEYCGIKSIDDLPASDVLSPNQINEWIRRATMPEPPPGDNEMGLARS